MRKGKGREDSVPVTVQTSSKSVLGGHPPASDDSSFRLRCLVEGEATVFTVTVSVNDEIGDLKELVLEKRKHGALHSVDAADLVLWKVRML